MAANTRTPEDEGLEKLAPAELGQRLMALPARRRLETILKRADAESVVAGMADQDFFVTVKEIGPQDALPLLSMGTMDQLSHVFDVEWWRKDTVLPAGALEWLDLLGRAGEGRLLSWLYQVDFELLTLLFKRWIRVDVLPEDMDMVEARENLPAHTIDDLYFWECRYPQYENLVQYMLSLLFEANHAFYLELMNHILWLPDTECEESAYRFHRGRLEDRGVPDFYDSLVIYRAPRPRELKRRKAWDGPPFEGSVPSFAMALAPQGDLFRRCLAEIRDGRLLDMLQFELASLANKVLVADELPPDQPQALHRAAGKAAAYVNLGLMQRSGDRLSAAASLLRDVYLEDLFRVGHEKVVKLRSRVQSLVKDGWLSRWPHGIDCLDAEWLEWVELVLQKTPQLRRRSRGAATGVEEDFFRTPRDLSDAEHRVRVLLTMGMLFDALIEHGASPRWTLLPDGAISRMEEVTLSSMIWTAASQFLHEGVWRVLPLHVAEWSSIWKELHPVAMQRAVDDWVLSILKEKDHLELAQFYLGPLEQEYALQMAPFQGEQGTVPDPRLMKFFLFTE